MNKKNSVLALALALLVALMVPRVLAQAAQTSQTSQTETSSVDPETKAKVQAKLQHISSELNLSDAQKQQLQPILQNEVQQMKAVKNDSSMSDDQKKAKAQEIHASAKTQMSTILTPDQQKKLASMREEAKEHQKY